MASRWRPIEGDAAEQDVGARPVGGTFGGLFGLPHCLPPFAEHVARLCEHESAVFVVGVDGQHTLGEGGGIEAQLAWVQCARSISDLSR